MVNRLDGTYDNPKDIKKARDAAKRRGDKTFKVDGLRYDTATGRRRPMSAAGSLEGLQKSIDSQKVRNKKDGMATGGMAKKKDFPDLTGDGKVTQKDILKGRGVLNTGGKVKKKGMAMGGMAKGMPAGGMKKKKNMSGGGIVHCGPVKRNIRQYTPNKRKPVTVINVKLGRGYVG
jgi:hypothetical protein